MSMVCPIATASEFFGDNDGGRQGIKAAGAREYWDKEAWNKDGARPAMRAAGCREERRWEAGNKGGGSRGIAAERGRE